MWTLMRPLLLVPVLAGALLLVPQVAACDPGRDNLVEEPGPIQQEFDQKVEAYNELLKQGRFNEAIVLGKEALSLQPGSAVAQVMVLKAKFAKRDVLDRLSSTLWATLTADLSRDPGSDTIQERRRFTERISGRLESRKQDASDGSSINFPVTLAADPSIDPRSDAIQEPRRIAGRIIGRFACPRNEYDEADVRRQLDASLERRIEVVDRKGRLTDAQKRKLRTAGRGDIKRLFDRLAALGPYFDPSVATHDDDLPDLVCGNSYLANAYEVLPGLFDQGSLFSKTLKTSLTEGQIAPEPDNAEARHADEPSVTDFVKDITGEWSGFPCWFWKTGLSIEKAPDAPDSYRIHFWRRTDLGNTDLHRSATYRGGILMLDAPVSRLEPVGRLVPGSKEPYTALFVVMTARGDCLIPSVDAAAIRTAKDLSPGLAYWRRTRE